MRRAAHVGALAAALFVLAGAAVEQLPHFDAVRHSFQHRSVPSSPLNSRTLLRILRRLDVVQPELEPDERFSSPTDTARQARPLPASYSVDRLPARELPCVQAVSPEQVVSGLRILSLTLDPGDLAELYAHPRARGREWERFGCVAYFDEGTLAFATGVGARLHGGRSRVHSATKSFRLYFRDLYGESRLPKGIPFGSDGVSPARLIAHNDVRRDFEHRNWHLVNPLAYDIARQIGALAPRTQPALFFVNGVRQGLYVLTDHLGSDYLQSHFGHDRFFVRRTKKDSGAGALYSGERGRARGLTGWLNAMRPLRMEAVAERVDLDNLSRWFLSVLFCGNTDAHQGPMLKDEVTAESRWFWINWDMDHSFMSKKDRRTDPWSADAFGRLLRKHDTRSRLMRRLLGESEAYREHFRGLFQEVMNHRLTPDFLQDRLEHYRRVGWHYGVRNDTFEAIVPEFFRRRREVLREQMRIYAGAGESYPVGVTAGGCDLRVDGYPISGSYAGWYFSESLVEVEVLEPCRSRFSHWRINGEDRLDASLVLRHEVHSVLHVEPILVTQEDPYGERIGRHSFALPAGRLRDSVVPRLAHIGPGLVVFGDVSLSAVPRFQHGRLAEPSAAGSDRLPPRRELDPA